MSLLAGGSKQKTKHKAFWGSDFIGSAMQNKELKKVLKFLDLVFYL